MNDKALSGPLGDSQRAAASALRYAGRVRQAEPVTWSAARASLYERNKIGSNGNPKNDDGQRPTRNSWSAMSGDKTTIPGALARLWSGSAAICTTPPPAIRVWPRIWRSNLAAAAYNAAPRSAKGARFSRTVYAIAANLRRDHAARRSGVPDCRWVGRTTGRSGPMPGSRGGRVGASGAASCPQPIARSSCSTAGTINFPEIAGSWVQPGAVKVRATAATSSCASSCKEGRSVSALQRCPRADELVTLLRRTGRPWCRLAICRSSPPYRRMSRSAGMTLAARRVCRHGRGASRTATRHGAQARIAARVMAEMFRCGTPRSWCQRSDDRARN